MKKNVILLFAAALLTAVLILQTSCNLTAPEYGIVTLDFENGAARSIGANGLPNLSDSTMQIDITGNSIVPITKQLEKDEPKVFSQFLPVGETIHIKVSIITPSATWTGFTDLTVESGDNEAAVKLNKVIASMRPIPFSVNGSSAPYTFKLNMGGTPLEIAQSGSGRDYLFFTRDGKGRLYAAYSDPPVVIRRYTSEGDYEKKLSLPVGVTAVDSFTTDLKTGKVYMSSGSTLYEIDDNGNLMHVIGSAGTIKASAAYNGYLFVYSSLPAGGQLQMYRLTGTPPALVGTLPQDPLKDIIPITDDPVITHQSGECQDMFAYGNKVYLVFTIGAPYDGSKAFYGGVLEYTYTEDGHITESGRYGFGSMESYIEYPSGSGTAVYRFNDDAPYERFYGARRIIGFEDGILYIADDGAIFRSLELVNDYKLIANINRIAKLDTRSGTLTFENTDAKWYREWR
ncbi:hypothetical protein HMPREF9727_00646 [Treponema denticola MYR-T]|uniref:Antigen n=1 Tax=Treponema denticola H1-T TaxID=999431 RepID=M2CC37_TREDN|nr:hypothetical protein [Treponema denticola]EMB30961.1 hypothetical protein HMPREF9727_00646 [Treponema denticola MYR-T]EMB31889.1 hypothetical protein HMPREF9725_01011 [Treponema denticola H1-T]